MGRLIVYLKMLSQVYRKTLLLGPLRTFCVASNIPRFDNLHRVSNYVDSQRPPVYCLLTTNNWSPLCNQAIKDFEAANQRFGGQVLFVRADVDGDHRIRNHYNAHCEPSVTMCVYGRYFDKHVGVNLDALNKKIHEMVAFYENSGLPEEIRFYEPYSEAFTQKYVDPLLEWRNSGGGW